MNTEIGKLLVVIGGLILAAGIIFIFFGDKLGWIGNLPGDIRIERDNFRVYFPLTTMILISIVLSVALTIIVKLFRGG
jgi:uncharacterized protein HemY